MKMNLALLLRWNNFSFDLMLYRLPSNGRKVDDSQERIDTASLILLASKESCFFLLVAFRSTMLTEYQPAGRQMAHYLTVAQFEHLFEVYFFL